MFTRISTNYTNLDNTSKDTNPVITKNPSKNKRYCKKHPPQPGKLISMTLVTVAYPDAEETAVVMTCAHSMFMNCIPLTHKQVSADVVEKI